MTEIELNALFNIPQEKIKNVYMTNSIKNVEEIQRIVKTFKMTQEQRKTTQLAGVGGIVAFKTILNSNN